MSKNRSFVSPKKKINYLQKFQLVGGLFEKLASWNQHCYLNDIPLVFFNSLKIEPWTFNTWLFLDRSRWIGTGMNVTCRWRDGSSFLVWKTVRLIHIWTKNHKRKFYLSRQSFLFRLILFIFININLFLKNCWYFSWKKRNCRIGCFQSYHF